MTGGYKYHYALCRENDFLVYSAYQSSLRETPGVTEKNELEDVDGSLFHFFELGGREIKLALNEEIGTVYLDSEIDLNAIINEMNGSRLAEKVM